MTNLTFAPATQRFGLFANRRSHVIDRLLAKVIVQTGTSCWEWSGYVSPNGYGMAGHQRVVYYAHRLSYLTFVGPIPTGMHLDHICRNTRCIKPDHLEPVTQAENNRRAGAARRAGQ